MRKQAHSEATNTWENSTQEDIQTVEDLKPGTFYWCSKSCPPHPLLFLFKGALMCELQESTSIYHCYNKPFAPYFYNSKQKVCAEIRYKLSCTVGQWPWCVHCTEMKALVIYNVPSHVITIFSSIFDSLRSGWYWQNQTKVTTHLIEVKRIEIEVGDLLLAISMTQFLCHNWPYGVNNNPQMNTIQQNKIPKWEAAQQYPNNKPLPTASSR